MVRRVSSSRLVGREAERVLLTDALARAAGGRPASVFVYGEAGVGKTRLVEEFAAGARAQGVQVWTGHCLPLAGGLLPYAPIVDALRAARADLGVERLRELAGSGRTRLGTLIPELRDDTPAATDDELAPLYADVLLLLEQLAAVPTVLVLEDLHWADPSTGALLGLLMRGLRECRLLLVCTYRDDELPPAHPLRTLLAELRRGPVDLLPLDRLDLDSTAAQLAGILPDPPSPELARRVFDRSGGNPFLAEELVAAGLHTDALPATLRDVLLLRARQLPPLAQEALRAVALTGRATEHHLLADVVDATPDELIAALAAAVDQHVLIPVHDRYAFRHALVAEAVVEDALPGDRIQLHRRLAEALTRRLPAGGANASALASTRAELAYHWIAAGDVPQALVATVDAGLAAERALAPAEARRHFERALSLWWEARHGRDRAALDLVGLHQHAAEAAYLNGDVAAALALVREGISHVDAERDAPRAGRLHLRLGRYLLMGAHDERDTMAAYETALDLVPVESSADRAMVTCGLAFALRMAARHRESEAWARASVTASREIGAKHEEAHALSTLGYDLTMLGDFEQGHGMLREAVNLGARVDTSPGGKDDVTPRCATCSWRTHANLSSALLWAGRFADAAEVALLGAESTQRYGTGDTFGVDLLGDAMAAMFWQGHWAELAELLPPDTGRRGHALTITNLWLPAAAVHTARGDFAEAERFLDATRQLIAAGGHFEVRVLLDIGLAELALWRGEPQVARARIVDGLAKFGNRDHGPLLARLLAVGARAEADAGSGSADAIDALLTETSSGPAGTPFSAALLAQARAELARVRGTAASAWASAVAAWSQLEAPYPLAYARWRQAEAVLAQAGRRDEAATLLGEAQDTARALAAQPLSREIAALSRRARLTIKRPDDRRARAQGLTPREEQVLVLLGQGSTNRQIARRLFIAEKTVSIHVSHILAKLAVPNRAAAAAAAFQLGLIEP